MRYSGMARRALEIAKVYLDARAGSARDCRPNSRCATGSPTPRRGSTSLGPRSGTPRIGAGERARVPVSMCKVFVASVVQDAVDLAVQCCGANGIGRDLPLSEFYESVRQFRIVDGADEVHRRVIARHALEDLEEAELEPLSRFGDPVGRRG